MQFSAKLTNIISKDNVANNENEYKNIPKQGSKEVSIKC